MQDKLVSQTVLVVGYVSHCGMKCLFRWC